MACNRCSQRDSPLNDQGHLNGATKKESARLHQVDALIMVPSPEANICNSGGSSITATLKSIAYAVGRGDLADQSLPPTSIKCTSARQHEELRSEQQIGMTFPTRQEADALMLKFWTYIHPIFPVLHRSSTESMYKDHYLDNQRSNKSLGEHGRIQKATLNIMFALGCQGSNQEDSAEQYYRRSTDYYSADTIDSPSLEVVQLLVLTGVYLQSTKYASRCWNVVGSAVRYAQYLSLDVDHLDWVFKSQLEKEMRRRVWYNCVLLDQSVFSLL